MASDQPDYDYSARAKRAAQTRIKRFGKDVFAKMGAKGGKHRKGDTGLKHDMNYEPLKSEDKFKKK